MPQIQILVRANTTLLHAKLQLARLLVCVWNLVEAFFFARTFLSRHIQAMLTSLLRRILCLLMSLVILLFLLLIILFELGFLLSLLN